MAAIGGISVLVINVCVVVLLLNLFSTASSDPVVAKFGYTGPVGPNSWGRLSPTYSACSNGKSQSPINIISHNCVINKNLKPLIMQYNHSEVATLVDNGFNVGIKYGENAGNLIVDGKTYNFKQMHWHSPSEHKIDGTQYAAELHLVHFSEDNKIAVLSILFHIGHPDPLMTKLQNKMNELARDVATQKETQVQLGTIDTHEIRKHSHKYYTYTGSLTTPPCSEIVTWFILGKEYFRCACSNTTLVLLPKIWDLLKLREVNMSACSFFNLDTDEPTLIAEDSKLENLRILVHLVLSYSKDTEDYSTERYWFPKLDFLTELKLLQVKFEISNSNDGGSSVVTDWDFHFPSNLKKLKLCDFPLTSDSLSTIAKLPNLEYLFLLKTIIEGEEWNMGEEDTFENLKFLYLEEVILAKWEVGEESFPMLQKLTLKRCRKLEEIPYRFRDIYSLEIIKLAKSFQLEDSALKIKQDVEEMTGEDKLQILGWNNILLTESFFSLLRKLKENEGEIEKEENKQLIERISRRYRG